LFSYLKRKQDTSQIFGAEAFCQPVIPSICHFAVWSCHQSVILSTVLSASSLA
jgi:hypothetical protein